MRWTMAILVLGTLTGDTARIKHEGLDAVIEQEGKALGKLPGSRATLLALLSAPHGAALTIGGLSHVPAAGPIQPQISSQRLHVPITMLSRREVNSLWYTSAALNVAALSLSLSTDDRELTEYRRDLEAVLDSSLRYLAENAGALSPGAFKRLADDSAEIKSFLSEKHRRREWQTMAERAEPLTKFISSPPLAASSVSSSTFAKTIFTDNKKYRKDLEAVLESILLYLADNTGALSAGDFKKLADDSSEIKSFLSEKHTRREWQSKLDSTDDFKMLACPGFPSRACRRLFS